MKGVIGEMDSVLTRLDQWWLIMSCCDYRIFQFANFKQTKKRVLAQSDGEGALVSKCWQSDGEGALVSEC